jgi:WD40-like Beta Propeller Repeat
MPDVQEVFRRRRREDRVEGRRKPDRNDRRRRAGLEDPLDGSGSSDTQEIYTVPANGGTPTRLTHTSTIDSQPPYSPPGGGPEIVFFLGGSIWVMNADGSGAHKLANANGYTPRWSPDGSKIAFTTYDASWRPTATMGRVPGDWPALRVQVLDVRTGKFSPAGTTYTDSDVNGPTWLSTTPCFSIWLRNPEAVASAVRCGCVTKRCRSE